MRYPHAASRQGKGRRGDIMVAGHTHRGDIANSRCSPTRSQDHHTHIRRCPHIRSVPMLVSSWVGRICPQGCAVPCGQIDALQEFAHTVVCLIAAQLDRVYQHDATVWRHPRAANNCWVGSVPGFDDLPLLVQATVARDPRASPVPTST